MSGVSARGYGHSLHAAAKEARSRLRPKVIRQVTEALKAYEYVQEPGHLIVCGDGTVLVVRTSGGPWCYHITGPERSSASCVMGGDRDKCIEAAREHARQSYGGVVWEART